MTTNRQNWAGNTPYCATEYHAPQTIAELQAIVRDAGKVRVVGARHCFNAICDCPETIITLDNLEKTVAIDHARRTATVHAGMTYGELAPQLHAAGYALHNMASLNHITVIGACMTATHGSGDRLGNLATAVAALELVTANGDLVTLSREKDGDTFNGAVVALGTLGVVTKVTLDLLPTFAIQQDVYEKLPMIHLDAHFDDIMGAGYSVSLFPNWEFDWVNTVWVKQQVVDGRPIPTPTTFYDATLAPRERPMDHNSDRYLTKMGEPGPWHERLIHFYFKDAALVGNELQSEYFVPRHHAVAAMKAVAQLRDGLVPLMGVSEIRSVAADQLWLSPAYEQDIIGIHFNWLKHWPGVQKMMPVVEAALKPFAPRPHWGKLFTIAPAAVQPLYPRLADFRALAQHYDPQGKFRNAFVDTYLFSD